MTESPAAVPRFSHQAMGTLFDVFISGEKPDYAAQAARAAFNEIDRFERLFSRFEPASEISRINRLKPGRETMIGFETHECLALAETIRLETAGAFDINARVLEKRGPGNDEGPISERALGEKIPGRGYEIGRKTEGFVFRRLDQDPAPFPGLDLDLGAIGKGFALDRALEILREWGVENTLIHGGTSTALAAGSPSERSADGIPGPSPILDSAPIDFKESRSDRETERTAGWPVGVGAGWPGAPSRVFLSGRALSGSGTEIKGEHILDPRTGAPARRYLAVWASSPTAARADALSTAFFIMAPEEIDDYTRRFPDTWACLVVDYGEVRVFNPGLLP